MSTEQVLSAPAPPSPWLAEAGSVDRCPSLASEIDADIAIVGAGYTGLSAALALRREGLEVVVLEARTAGYGASGRNAGHLTPTIGKDLPTLTKMYGRDRVAGLVHLQETAISHVEHLIETYAIDCGYERVGNVIAAVHPRQHAALDRAARAAAEHGIPGEILEPDAMERRGLPRSFTRGYFEPHGGILDPGRYVLGLRAAVLAAGATLYEDSSVLAIDDDAPARGTPSGTRGAVTVSTSRGRVRCRYVVIATNGYTPLLGRPRNAGVRIQVQLFRTAPLTAEQIQRLDWRGREGIYTAHEILESYRLTTDNRIVGGSKAIRAGYGDTVLPDVDPATSSALERMFYDRFPELGDVRVDDHWGGPIFMSLDFLPVIGFSGRTRNVLHSVAYAGHGVAMASYAGEMVADLIMGRGGPGHALWSRRSLSTPPEPLRWLAFQGLVRFFSAIDRRADRNANGRPAAGG